MGGFEGCLDVEKNQVRAESGGKPLFLTCFGRSSHGTHDRLRQESFKLIVLDDFYGGRGIWRDVQCWS